MLTSRYWSSAGLACLWVARRNELSNNEDLSRRKILRALGAVGAAAGAGLITPRINATSSTGADGVPPGNSGPLTSDQVQALIDSGQSLYPPRKRDRPRHLEAPARRSQIPTSSSSWLINFATSIQ